MRATCPAVSGPPSVDAITIRSFDSSVWNVPELPSGQVALMVFGAFSSVPPVIVPRPTSSVPESQETPTAEHHGALSVELKTAVVPPPLPAGFTVRFTEVVCVRLPVEPAMEIVAAPVVAVALAVRVSVVDPVELAGLNEAVTPAGSPAAAKVTLLLK